MVASFVRFTFTGLHALNGTNCYVDVDEIKAFTNVESGRFSSVPPVFVFLGVLVIAVLVGVGAVLFMRQRQLAERMGVRIVGTDGYTLKSINSK
ncbi:hypothetical protein HK405_006597 [Cladochytrium tenue]|nr:hypothetical protein HK405_006597 [Cladochytrium tenue]